MYHKGVKISTKTKLYGGADDEKKVMAIFCWLLCWCLSVGVFAEEAVLDEPTSTPVITDDYTKAIETLVSFGILGEDFDPTAVVTRGAFVDKAMYVLGLGSAFVPEDTEFQDVTKENPFSGAIGAAYAMGLINGHDDGCFYPESAVTGEQTIKILTLLLGYGPYVEDKGGYLAGNMAAAARTDLTYNISCDLGQELTWGTCAQFLYNALHAEVFQQIEYPSGRYEAVRGETPLTLYLNIYREEGTVTETRHASVNSAEGSESQKVKIDDVVYDTNGIEIEEFLGVPVEFYYKKSNKEGNRYLIICRVKEGVKQYRVAGADIKPEETDRTFVSWDDGDKEFNRAIDASPLVIYNGKKLAVEEFQAEMLHDTKYSTDLLLIDTDNDAVIEVIRINAYDPYVIDEINKKSFTFTDLHNDGRVFVLDVNRAELQYEIFFEDKELTFDSLRKGDVCLVATSKDGSLIHIEVCRYQYSGTIVLSNGKGFKIDDWYFEYHEKNKEEIQSMLELGEVFTVYFAPDERIIGIKKGNSKEEYVYALYGTVQSDGAFAEKSVMKAVRLDGTAAEYEFADNVTVNESRTADVYQVSYNGKVYKSAALSSNVKLTPENVIYAAGFVTYDNDLACYRFNHGLIKVTFDDDGYISNVDFPVDNRTQSGGTGKYMEEFSRDYSFIYYDSTFNNPNEGTSEGKKCVKFKSIGMINNRVSTKGMNIFEIPTREMFQAFYQGTLSFEEIQQAFRQGTSSGWANEEKIYYLDVYDMSKTRVPAVALMENSTGGNDIADQYMFVVDEVLEALDENGNRVTLLCGLFKGKYVELPIDKKAFPDKTVYTSLQKADCLRIAQSMTGNVTGIIKLFSMEKREGYLLYAGAFDEWGTKTDPQGNAHTQSSYQHTTTSSWEVAHRVVHARFSFVDNEMTGVVPGMTETGQEASEKLMAVRNTDSVYLYDEATDTLSVSSKDQIDPNDPRQSAVIRMRWSQGYDVLIIQRKELPNNIYWIGGYM